MTLEDRLWAALARRGPQRLSHCIAEALGLSLAVHITEGRVCGFAVTEEQAVELLERHADRGAQLIPRGVVLEAVKRGYKRPASNGPRENTSPSGLSLSEVRAAAERREASALDSRDRLVDHEADDIAIRIANERQEAGRLQRT